jgi:hypothetical protein
MDFSELMREQDGLETESDVRPAFHTASADDHAKGYGVGQYRSELGCEARTQYHDRVDRAFAHGYEGQVYLRETYCVMASAPAMCLPADLVL